MKAYKILLCCGAGMSSGFLAQAAQKAANTKAPGTKVAAVNTINCDGKLKRMGRYEGRTASYKKAIVTLTEDSKTIEFFESMR